MRFPDPAHARRASLPALLLTVTLGGSSLIVQHLAAQAPAPAAGAQGAANPAPAIAPEDLARIEGSVRSTTGEAIPRATITANAPARTGTLRYTATADDEGNFVLENMAPADNYRITAQRPGFVTAAYGSRNYATLGAPLGTPVKLGPGQTLRDVAIVLVPQGVIAGKITDQNGDPVFRARVTALQYRYTNLGRRLNPLATESTDDLGEYRINSLPPGNYYLSVAPINSNIGVTATDSEGVESKLPTYYPNSPDLAGAAQIHVAAGASLNGINLQLLTGTVYSLSGAASPPPDRPIAIAILPVGSSVTADSFLRGTMQQTRPDGSFQFSGLRPGTYILQTTGLFTGGNPSTMSGATEVTVKAANLTGVVLPMTPGVQINGTVSLEDGASATPSPAPFVRMRVSLIAPLPQTGMRSAGGNAEVQGDGTFEITGLAAAHFWVNIAGLPSGLYLKSARFGGADITHSGLDLTSGVGGNLQIVLSNKASDLTGVIPNGIENGDDPPILGAIPVVLWPRTQNLERIRRELKLVTTNQNGAFQLEGLAPGEYYLAAFDAPDQELLRVPEFLVQFHSKAEELEIDEGAHLAHQLEVIEAAAVAAAEEKLP